MSLFLYLSLAWLLKMLLYVLSIRICRFPKKTTVVLLIYYLEPEIA